MCDCKRSSFNASENQSRRAKEVEGIDISRQRVPKVDALHSVRLFVGIRALTDRIQGVAMSLRGHRLRFFPGKRAAARPLLVDEVY